MRFTLLLTLIAAPATAQTVDCYRDALGGVHCRDGSGVAPVDQGSALSAGAALVPNYAEREAAAQALRAEQDRQWLRQRVGALVAKGRCDDARTAALKGGDFDLAERVAGLCKAQ